MEATLEKRVDAYIDEVWEDVVADISKLVSHPSVADSAQAEPGAPFGSEVRRALDCGLDIARRLGYVTGEDDGYLGWGDIPGESKTQVATIAHVDVVPAGPGWETDPFTVVRKGDVIYGRGVNDDKGAVIASMFAMKAVKDMGIPMNKRVRLLMGCNEETGSACMQYYAEHGEPITTGFTPDGYFPGIFGEKGGMKLNFYSKHTNIISMNGWICQQRSVQPLCDCCTGRCSGCPEVEGLLRG